MSTPTIAKPTLTAAQIIADLDSLNNCEASAATALLNASKHLSPGEMSRRSRTSVLPDPPKFDSLGKRIVAPALSRINSDASSIGRAARNSVSSGSNGNGNRTGLESPYEKDEDMRRAKELVELFEKKDNFTRMGITGLGKSKERVDEVVEKHAQKHMEERQKVAQARQVGVR